MVTPSVRVMLLMGDDVRETPEIEMTGRGAELGSNPAPETPSCDCDSCRSARDEMWRRWA